MREQQTNSTGTNIMVEIQSNEHTIFQQVTDKIAWRDNAHSSGVLLLPKKEKPTQMNDVMTTKHYSVITTHQGLMAGA